MRTKVSIAIIAALATALAAGPAAARPGHGGGARGGGHAAAAHAGGAHFNGARFAGNHWHNGGGWHGNWHGGRYYRPGYGLGFATGAIIGSAPYWGGDYGYYDSYAAAPDYGVSTADDQYCAQRYRSYDPSSGTYLGYDGLRHPCP